MSLIIPRWLYEKAVHDLGREVADKIMANHHAVVADDWFEATSPEPVKLSTLGDLQD